MCRDTGSWMLLRGIIALAVLIAPAGCDRQPPADSADGNRSDKSGAAASQPMAWQRIHDAEVVAVDDALAQQALESATAEARRSLDDARQRWTVANAAERHLWAIKWAAPRAPAAAQGGGDAAAAANAADGASAGEPQVEHVWVQPINWSPFRIEGRLLSPPAAALESGRTQGEIVSFPVDEVSDWIHFSEDPAVNPAATFEGGYTVKVLEQRYGRPPR